MSKLGLIWVCLGVLLTWGGSTALAGGNAVGTVHPDSTKWPSLFKKDFSNALCDRNVWFYNKEGLLTANRDQVIWTDKEYENFVLDIEYRLDPAANSGVLIYNRNMKNWIPHTVEIQLLDDLHPRWRKDPLNMKNGSLYGHLGPKVSKAKPAREWNRMTITAKGKRVTVALNGEIYVEADLSTMTSAKTNPDGSRIPRWLSRPWADLPTCGRIGLQGKHGGATIYFRSVKIKQL